MHRIDIRMMPAHLLPWRGLVLELWLKSASICQRRPRTVFLSIKRTSVRQRYNQKSKEDMPRRSPVQSPKDVFVFFPRSTAHTLYANFFALSSVPQKIFFSLEPSLELMCAVPNFFVLGTRVQCVLRFFMLFGSARTNAGKSSG